MILCLGDCPLDRDQRTEAEQAQRQATRAEEGGALSVEEQIRQVRQLLDAESAQEALALLASMHPADQALVVRAVSSEVRDSLAQLLPVAQLAAILEHLDAEEAAPVLQRLDPSSIVGVLDAVRPEVAADVLRQIPAEGAVKARSETVRAEEIVPLMAYPDETAGGLMTPVIVTVSEETTVAQAMALLRHIAPLPQQQTSFFVVDSQRKLLGNVSLPSLVFSSPQSRVH